MNEVVGFSAVNHWYYLSDVVLESASILTKVERDALAATHSAWL